jgi:hypothetical protein
MGPYAIELTGYYENTHIYTVMAQALSVLRLRPSGVCPQVASAIPAEVRDDALRHPEKYYGWGMPANPNLAPGPANPWRTWLSLRKPTMAYYPTVNPPVWTAGFP